MQTFGLKELLGRRQAPSDGTMTKCESAHAHVRSRDAKVYVLTRLPLTQNSKHAVVNPS